MIPFKAVRLAIVGLALLSSWPLSLYAADSLPAAPLGLAMTANSAESLTLNWFRGTADEATTYVVYASDAKDKDFQKVATVKERTWTEQKLKPGQTRYYKVAAVNAAGEGKQSNAAQGFTLTPSKATPFPVKIAKSMCLSLNSKIVSDVAPKVGKLAELVDGFDATSCGIEGKCEVKIQLNPQVKIDDAAYLLINFRSDMAGKDYAYNINWRALRDYVILESHDSTDGKDGTWKEIASGSNTFLDGVITIPNNRPKWIGIRNSSGFQLCRLEIFRAAPKGERNDSWIFTGDSLVVQDMMGGSPERHTVWFSDLVREKYPDRHPIVVNSSQGGEVMANTYGRLKNSLPILSPANDSGVPVGTIVCFEAGFNDVGVGGGPWMGPKIIKTLTEVQELCQKHDMILIPVRIEYSTGYLDKSTLEPTKDAIYYNTLSVNLAGVDVFAREKTPYAVDPKTQLPYADYWTYTRKNYETALAKDGVHHTKAGSDGINQLWVEAAGKMIYKP